jgi:signal transduction histidine kinase
MSPAGLSLLPAQVPGDPRLLFQISVVTVAAVALFAGVAVVLLLRRRYRRSLAEQKMAVMGLTSARILHQIKNPVQSLLLQAELLEEFERGNQEEMRRESGRAILGEAQRLATMLNELSAWTSGSKRPLALVETPLHELLAGIARQEQRQAERRGVCLELDTAQEAVAHVDVYYFRQAIENLLRNAEEAMKDQPNARLRLELDRGRSHAVVRVIDNGPGIPPEKLPRIFEPFVSTKGSGMGLGLPIAKEIIEKHGGELTVDTLPEKGTTFTIRLPLHGARRSISKVQAFAGGGL